MNPGGFNNQHEDLNHDHSPMPGPRGYNNGPGPIPGPGSYNGGPGLMSGPGSYNNGPGPLQGPGGFNEGPGRMPSPDHPGLMNPPSCNQPDFDDNQSRKACNDDDSAKCKCKCKCKCIEKSPRASRKISRKTKAIPNKGYDYIGVDEQDDAIYVYLL